MTTMMIVMTIIVWSDTIIYNEISESFHVAEHNSYVGVIIPYVANLKKNHGDPSSIPPNLFLSR